MTNGSDPVAAILDSLGEIKHVYPLVYRYNGDPTFISQGMTLRERFAGLAMQGWLASWPTGQQKFYMQAPKDIAEQSVRIADSLIQALENADG